MWFFTVVVVLLIGAVAVVASGRWGGMGEAYDDRPDLRVPSDRPLGADDIESSRFGVGVRGYRMDEVDSLLERVSREVAERDRRIADLERAVRPILQAPDGSGFAPRTVENPSFAETDIVHAPVGRHAARRPPTPHPDARTPSNPPPKLNQPVPPAATDAPTTGDEPKTTDSAQTAPVTQTAQAAETAQATEATETTETTATAETTETAETARSTDITPATAAGPVSAVIPQLRDNPEVAGPPKTEDEAETAQAAEGEQGAQTAERPVPAVIPQLRDPKPAGPPTVEPSDVGQAATASDGAAGDHSGTAEQEHAGDAAETAEIPQASEASDAAGRAPGAEGDSATAAGRSDGRVWSVHGAPSQTVKPAPKRTDDAVRPAPMPGRRGPKVMPRSVPTAVEDAKPEGDGAEVVNEDSAAERRA